MRLMEHMTTMIKFVGTGIDHWIDVPPDIEIDYDREWLKKRVEAAEDHRRRHGPDSTVPFNMGRPSWPYHVIPLRRRRPGTDEWTSSLISIDVRTNTIDFRVFTDATLFGARPRSAGDIGVGILTLPVALPLLPFLFIVERHYKAQERRYSMSRHSISLLAKLSRILDPAQLRLLEAALRNTWEENRR